jgi:excisionase family DNA binding protein
MPRVRTSRLFPVAVSPAQAADALGVRAEEVRDLIESAGIPLYQIGMRRRVLIEDLVRAIRRHWQQARIENQANQLQMRNP